MFLIDFTVEDRKLPLLWADRHTIARYILINRSKSGKGEGFLAAGSFSGPQIASSVFSSTLFSFIMEFNININLSEGEE
jgi:hypothetical protein